MHQQNADAHRRDPAFIQQERDNFHVDYRIRKPSKIIPNYDLPVVEPHEKSLKAQSRSLRAKPCGLNPYAYCSQYKDRASQRESPTPIASSATKNRDVTELPASEPKASVSPRAEQASSTATTRGEVLNAEEADILDFIAQGQRDIAQARESIAIAKTRIRESEVHLIEDLMELASIRQHVQDKWQPRDKGAYQNTHGSSSQQEPAPYCPSFMQDYLPAPNLNPRDPEENQNVRWCETGRPNPKELVKGQDRYWGESLCVKHKREADFVINVGSLTKQGVPENDAA